MSAPDPILRAQLAYIEGDVHDIYRDEFGNLTGGIGWNFTANGIPDAVIDLLYSISIDQADAVLDQIAPWWRGLDPVRRRAMQNLAFNLGHRLGEFHEFLSSMHKKAWGDAAVDLVHSLWWRQVGRRGPFVRGMILTGRDPVIDDT